MNFIKNSLVYTYGEIKIKNLNNKFLILKAAATNNNQVLHEKVITKRDTRGYSIKRNSGGANLLQKCSKFFFRKTFSFGIANSVLVLIL